MLAEPSLSPYRRAGLRLVGDEEARATGVLVSFSDRHGGVSRPPYDSLNLAARVGDDHAAVMENRARVARAVAFRAERLVLARQVHGAELIEVASEASGVIGEADGLVVRGPGPVAGILTADCAPVVVAGEDGIALLHAGWRGLVAGVIQRGVEALARAARAWIGPSIRSCCYQVGPDVVEAFEAAGLPVAAEDRVDPADAARAALQAAGVASVASTDECTACSPRYFSYRRDGVTGRQGAFAGYVV